MQYSWKCYLPGCLAGNIIELYEFVIYGYFANTIGRLFFPLQHSGNALLTTFAIFATGNLCRPFSAIVLGYFGDTLGRRKSLIFSISVMAIATLCIGLLPTYAAIGITAPILLIVLRVLQGLSMTSEEIAAALFLMESATTKEKAYASSFALGSVYLGLLFGSLIAALIFVLFDSKALLLWGWRIPFIIGGLGGLVTLLMRISQPESNEFKSALEKNKLSQHPLKILFTSQKASIFKMTCLCSSFAVAVYLFAIYIPNTFKTGHLHQSIIMCICSVGFIVAFLTSLGIGKLVDKIGSVLPLQMSSIGFLLLSYPIFILLSSQSLLLITLAYILFGMILGCSAGSLMYLILNYFPFHIRFSGSCISFNLSMSFFGGTAPFFALFITKITTLSSSPAILLMMTAILSLISLFYTTRTIS